MREYLFSVGTVDRAVKYYEDMKNLPNRTTGPDTWPGFYRWYVSAPGNPLHIALQGDVLRN